MGKSNLKLKNGSRVAVIGGGPSGSIFSYFLLDIAKRMGITLEVDIYEPKDFDALGPRGCNFCGGIVSESLVQIMASEGILLPSEVIQKGIGSYVMHTDSGTSRIDNHLEEKRIAAVFRGGGPLGAVKSHWASFDGFLLSIAKKENAHHIQESVKEVSFDTDGRVIVSTKKGDPKSYDLVVAAAGLNMNFLRNIAGLDFGYVPPATTKTTIREVYLGKETIKLYFGNAMHVFLLDIPRLKFAALIPKEDYVTMVLLGDKINRELLDEFLETPAVRELFPRDFVFPEHFTCQCSPMINIEAAQTPYTDRLVLIGDSATSKLYKNGIGAAYKTAKAAATTALLKGISKEDFETHYAPACQKLEKDNKIGKVIFSFTEIIQKAGFIKKGMLRVLEYEKVKAPKKRHLSTVLWDVFTGSAPYKEIVLRMLHPGFWWPVLRESFYALIPFVKETSKKDKFIGSQNSFGKTYQDKEIILKQGDFADRMFVVLSGEVEVVKSQNGVETYLATLKEGDFFGEMALFDAGIRTTTIRSKGESQLISVDKEMLIKRVQADPSVAYRLMRKMTKRIKELNERVVSDTDNVTTLLNRRKIEEVITHYQSVVDRYEINCLMILFTFHCDAKACEEEHLTVFIAHYLKSYIRKVDFFARWESDIFLLFSPYLDQKSAQALGEKVQELINDATEATQHNITCDGVISQLEKGGMPQNIYQKMEKRLQLGTKGLIVSLKDENETK